MTSIAEYNNNPGNLKPPPKVKYEGQIGVDERGFAIFENAEAGRKALIQDILIKQKRGLNTPESFIDQYAPAGKENPEEGRENYKIKLAQHLGLKSTSDPFPQGSEQKIADLIASFESGQSIGQRQTKNVEIPEVFDQPSIIPKNRQMDELMEDAARAQGEVAGLIGGAGVAASRLLGTGALKGMEKMGAAQERGRLAAQAAAAAEDPRMARILQGTIEPESGASGRARMQGFNIETAQQTARAKQAGETIGALQRAGSVAQDASQVLANAPGLTSSQAGVLYSRGAPSPVTPSSPVTPPSVGALEKVKGLFEDMMGPGTKGRALGGALYRYGFPILGGYQAGSEFAALENELQKRDPNYGKVISQAVGGLGALGSMFPLTAPIGVPMAITGPLMSAAIERGQDRPLGQLGDISAP